jgi:hypothetical protein
MAIPSSVSSGPPAPAGGADTHALKRIVGDLLQVQCL